jgi:hypothetical protein
VNLFNVDSESIANPTMQVDKDDDNIFWPRDLLPKDFPDARIYTFGYDSKLVSLSSTGQRAKLTFTQHAHDLFVTLNQELDEEV